MGEWWDVREQSEEQERGRCSGLLVPEAGRELSRGVKNGGKYVYILEINCNCQSSFPMQDIFGSGEKKEGCCP